MTTYKTTTYKTSDGDRIPARKVHGKFKSGSWEPVEKQADGTFIITDENGDQRTLIPITD